MAGRVAIQGKNLIIIVPRAHVKCVSLIFHQNRATTFRIKSGAPQKAVENERSTVFSRHVSVIYISVRLIISATWVRQIPYSFDLDTSTNADNEKRLDNGGNEEGIIHESLFMFDKAFAQEIKYLFAELDFDLYMCRDKQSKLKQRQAFARRIPVWKPKDQQQTFVYFVRQGNGHRGLGYYQQDLTVEEYIEQVKLQKWQSNVEKIDGEIKKDEEYCGEERYDDVSVEDYLKQCEEEDLKVEDYIELCEEEQKRKEMTVEEYLRLCKEEEEGDKDVTVEEYLRMCNEEQSLKDMTIEEYLRFCEDEEGKKDLKVEEYLRLCREDQDDEDMSVEEYLKQCQNEREKNDLTVEEYLRLHKEGQTPKDMTVEEYLILCKEEEDKEMEDMTVEEYLRLHEEGQTPKDMTVEEYLRLCKDEEDEELTDMTVEEYLRLCREDQDDEDMSVEEYLKQCQNEREKNDLTVEEYLRLHKEGQTPKDMTVEEYLRLCREDQDNEDMSVEEYLKQCQNEREKNDLTVEEYLRLHKEGQTPKDMTVEEYLRLCKEEEDEVIKDMTVEEYIKLCEEKQVSNDITVEECLRLCEEKQVSKEMTVEEYLKTCEEDQHSKDISVEEYLRQCKMEKCVHLTIEEYIFQCEQENESHANPSDDFELWGNFKSKLYGGESAGNSACYEITEEKILYSQGKQLKEGEREDGRDDNRVIGCLSLQNITFGHDQDDFIITSDMIGQPRFRLEVEAEEEELTESVAEEAQSLVNDWTIFDKIDKENSSSADENSSIEEQCVSKVLVRQSDESDMEAILNRHGMIFSAELWLLFPPYRRNPWRQISVLYRDDVAFDWSISEVIAGEEMDETIVEELEVKNEMEEESLKLSPVVDSMHSLVTEEELLVTHVGANFAEIEFSFLETLEEDDANSNNNNNNNNYNVTNGKTEFHELDAKNIEDHEMKFAIPKKMIPKLNHNGHYSSDELLNKNVNFHFTPLTSLTKKGLVYKSKEGIFTGCETDGRSPWNSNLERIHCKHAKTITVPETLRRTVSSEFMKVDAVDTGNEAEANEQDKHDNDNEATSTLLFSPLKIGSLGKNLKESNV